MRKALKFFGLAVAVLGLAAGAAVPARAGIIVQYDFPGGSFSHSMVGDFTSAGDVNATGSSAYIAPASNVFGVTAPDTLYLGQNVLSTTAAAAVANQQFFQFTVTPNAGYEFNLSSLTFDAGMESYINGPSGYVLRSSVDGFSTDLSTGGYVFAQPFLTPFSTDLSGAAFQHLGAALTFRVYNYSSVVGWGTIFDNVTLNGVTARVQAPATVPEPSTLASAGMAVLMGLGYAWRRRKRAA